MKVMTADVQRECIPQDIHIELAREVPCESGFKWRQNGAGAEIKMIDFTRSRKAAVKISGDFFAGHDSDGGGQFTVERRHPVKWVHRNFRRWIEMSGLRDRVYAGISATRAIKAQRLFRDLLQGSNNHVLHGIAANLRLPTVVRAAVIGNRKLEAQS